VILLDTMSRTRNPESNPFTGGLRDRVKVKKGAEHVTYILIVLNKCITLLYLLCEVRNSVCTVFLGRKYCHEQSLGEMIQSHICCKVRLGPVNGYNRL
jgi:hypothetical protein